MKKILTFAVGYLLFSTLIETWVYGLHITSMLTDYPQPRFMFGWVENAWLILALRTYDLGFGIFVILWLTEKKEKW